MVTIRNNSIELEPGDTINVDGDLWTYTEDGTLENPSGELITTVEALQLHEDDTNNPHGVTTEQIGAAELDANGKVLTEQIPDLALNDVFVTSEEDGRLTVEEDLGINVEPGDIVVETYQNPSEAYMKNETPYDDPDSWILVSVLSSPVMSVNGQTGEIEVDEMEEHGSEFHNTDTLHNESVGIPKYSTESDVPSIPEGHMVYIEDERLVYYEDGQ